MNSSTNIDCGQRNGERLVVFIGGFDPRGARHYHQLMRTEAEKQTKVSGVEYQVGARIPWAEGVQSDLSHSIWTISAQTENVQACDYLFIEWSDFVRKNWPIRTWNVIKNGWETYKAVWKIRKVLPPLQRETPYVLWTLGYPIVYGLFFLILAILVLFFSVIGRADFYGVILGVVAALSVCLLGYKLDKLVHVSWLLRILNFAHQSARQPNDGLQGRWVTSANIVAQQIKKGYYQEVVVVGFSVGSAMAVPFVHALRAALQRKEDGLQRVNLVTLGNCIPLFTLMPQFDDELHCKLLDLAQDENLYWVDISSPSDSVSFGMCNLMQLSIPSMSIKDRVGLINPRHMCSPRFHKLFSARSYRWLKRNKMRMHFQYLMTSEISGSYDYLGLLTYRGPLMEFIYKRLVR